MYGMPLSQALVFVIAVILIIGTTQRRYLHPFVAIVVVAAAFGYVAGFPTSVLTQNLRQRLCRNDVFAGSGDRRRRHSLPVSPKPRGRPTGWRQSLSTGKSAGRGFRPARSRPVSAWSQALARCRRPRLRSSRRCLRPIAGDTGAKARKRHDLAGAGDFGEPWPRLADPGTDRRRGHSWRRVATRCSVRPAAGGSARRLWRGLRAAAIDDRRRGPIIAAAAGKRRPTSRPERPSGSPLVLILAITVPLLLLMVQSVGDIPSEPLGGGPTRELILGIGRPLILFLVGVGIMVAGNPRMGFRLSWRFRLDRRTSSAMSPTSCSSFAPPAACSGSARKPAWRKCSASACWTGMPRRWAACWSHS